MLGRRAMAHLEQPSKDVANAAAEPHPRVAELIEHWRQLAPGPGLLPGRRHFNPMKVPKLLPNLWLLEVVAGPPRRYRYRLIGSRIIDKGALARVGDFLDDPRITENTEQAVRLMDTVAAAKQPDWRRGPPVAARHSRDVASLERVLLPLAEDGANVDMILAMTLFYSHDGQVL
jgi:hypothetical protein